MARCVEPRCCGVLAAAMWGLIATPVVAGPAWLLDATVVTRQADVIAVEDIAPTVHGSFGGAIGVNCIAPGGWGVELRGGFGGSWLNLGRFGDVDTARDFGWQGALIAKRFATITPGTVASCGLGVEYGEFRSWFARPLRAEDGPHNYATGGVIEVGVSHGIGRYADVLVVLGQSAYRARARHPNTGERFTWLGRATELGVGLRWHLNPPKPSTQTTR